TSWARPADGWRSARRPSRAIRPARARTRRRSIAWRPGCGSGGWTCGSRPRTDRVRPLRRRRPLTARTAAPQVAPVGEKGVSTALPDPALVVLVGASGSGKSAWAQARYRPQEIVSSDQLRGVVGSGEHDLDASVDAFAVLDQVVAARLKRGLNTVVDTL